MTTNAKKDNEKPSTGFDPIAFQQAMIKAYERAQPVFQDYISTYTKNLADQNFDPMNISASYTHMLEDMAENPQKYMQASQNFWSDWMTLWQESTLKFMGEKSKSVIEPEKGDRRFKAAEWQESALFDFIKQSYLLTTKWMQDTVQSTDGLSAKEKEKLAFFTKLYAEALSPTNFAFTNPEVIKETMNSGGQNLVRGFENLMEDIERGKGELKISMTDYEAFKLGENIATTPGNVIYQNDLIQLIQYTPTTEKVHKRPLLIIPPWINKYYILDLREENSFIKHAVEQGHTVFTISWVNPTQKLAKKTFEDYMHEGILDALDQIEKITGEKDCNAVGYCLGGTLLAITLAYLKAKGKADRIASATYLVTLIDFEHAGDLKLFMDEEQIKEMDRLMEEHGMLEAKQLRQTFNLLRSNDLIWSFVVNNYLMGKEPFPFDLLYWNDDSTNMPAAMHSFYLRNMYRDNKLVEPGGIEMDGTPIDITSVRTPSYFLSTREDHITPWKATYAGTQIMGGGDEITFTLAASGHIAGVINGPAKNKYCYWTESKTPADPEEWLENAKQSEGSWWPHWAKWQAKQNGKEMVAARKPAKGLEPAPGSYVQVKAD